MKKVAIAADTMASIPQELIKKYGIQLTPVLLHLENKTYKDTIDIKTSTELFELIKKSGKFPTTSVPPLGQYIEVYRQLSRKAGNIFMVTVSSGVSGCFNSATQAKKMIESELPDINIQVFDSKTTIGAMGLIVLAAARAAASGQDMAAVVKVAQDVRSKVNMIGITDSLSWLARSGRISKAAAMVGSILSMKPITGISTSLGRVVVLARPRTRKKALQVLLEMVKQKLETTSPLHFVVDHACAPEEAERLKQIVLGQFNCAEAFVWEISPAASVICGPGEVGLSFYQE